MRLRTAELATSTSKAPTSPPPTRGRSRWYTIAVSAAESCVRTWACCSAGKTSMMRDSACDVSLVCSVAKTRWPVSAMVSANWIDSRSRISPTRSTSGSARRAERRASSNECVSVPTSRWLTVARMCRVDVLDRVLDGQDVARPLDVDLVDDRGERRRLSRPGRAGDQDQALVPPGEVADDRRQAQFRRCRDPLRDHPQRERGEAALAEGVASHPGQVPPA